MILVLAGNVRQFERFVESKPQHRRRLYRYAPNVLHLVGHVFDGVEVTGSFHLRADARQMLEVAQARLKGRAV